MSIKFKDLELDLQKEIVPSLRQFFDQITYENRIQWIMVIHYGPIELVESFTTYEMEFNEKFEMSKIEEIFEKRKLYLFLNGVYLYFRESIKKIKLVCDAFQEHYDNTT